MLGKVLNTPLQIHFSFFLSDAHWCPRTTPPPQISSPADKPTKRSLLNQINPGFTYGILLYIISLYRSPSQTHDEFDNLLLNFEQFLCDIFARNPFFVLITGDFNATTAKLWRNDTATTEVTKIDSITTSYSFSQIISDPAYIFRTEPPLSNCFYEI